jgi:hypothetical protein
MAGSYLNIVSFLLTTLFYYIALKPTLKIDVVSDPIKFKQYTSSNYLYLAIYLLLVLIVQFIVNSSVISTTCGGSITENLGSAGLITFIPWIFIFGVVIIILVIYPGFKSAFSDVIGYYYVSSSANKILTTLLIDKNVQAQIDADNTSTEQQKQSMQKAADTIIKICGNTSILINQIVPNNFLQYWQVLTPLMKKEYQEPGQGQDLMNKLFDLVVTRDNVGEAMWFIYTGILLTSIVQLKIASKGCSSSPTTMQNNYQSYLKQQEAADAKQQKSTSTVYTLSGSG